MNFFTLSGIDGCGKTTQLKLIIEHLQKKDFKVATFHLIDFSLANKIKSRLKNKDGSNPPAISQASTLSLLLRKIFIIIDVIRFKSYYRNLQKQGYNILITDRYFYDQIINIFYLSKVFDVSVFPLWARIVLFFMIKPTKSFYLDVTPEVALSREKEIEQGIDYLNAKKIIFDMLAPKWKMVKIDADQDLINVNQNIKNSL